MSDAGGANRARVMVMGIVALAAAALAASVVWGLRTLIVPVAVGGLLAYICRPLVARLERFRMPRGVAVGLLLCVFVGFALVCVNSLRTVMPSETGLLELRIRALYALNHRYQALMGLDASWKRGNRLYQLAHRDLDPLMDQLIDLLALIPEERAQFRDSLASGGAAISASSGRLVEYDRANVAALALRARRTASAETAGSTPAGLPPNPASTSATKAAPPALGDGASAWMVAPLVFLFLLSDTGSLKRGLLSAVPNRLFEPALAVLADLDEALGNYVRGIFVECCSLGVTVMVFISLVGVPLRWAVAIGVFTGASNIVPYMGFAAALLGGLGYALLAEDIRPLLPFVTAETFVIWVVVAVAVAELIKNVVYEPIVLGGAVKLHPIVVVFGVVGGAILFGPAGMFLAIPTITVVRVLVASSARHLAAYGVI